MNPHSSRPRPNLYSGCDIPFSQLSPSQFEDFTFACLTCLGPTLGFEVEAKPSGTSDGGFDVQARQIKTGKTVCIQCKHQGEALGTPQLAAELAKVAANAVLDGASIAEHRFICTGGVRSKLRAELRESSRQVLLTEAGNALAYATAGELLTLKKRLEGANLDPRSVAEAYVRGLDSIVTWGFHEFNVALSKHWSDVLPIAERFFQIQTVVLEHPRASFDRVGYISEHCNLHLAIEPRLVPATFPSGISATSAVDPGPRATPSIKTVEDIHGLAKLELGQLAIVLGSGGVGKTEALKLTRARILQVDSESTLPILFSLNQYTAGGLDRVIHQAIGVIHGTWRSLPDRIILLCDGLNECATEISRAFLSELAPLLRSKHVACVITTRDTAYRTKLILPEASYVCARVESITPIGLQRLAEEALDADGVTQFVSSYRAIADTSSSPLMWTPFAVRSALSLWCSDAKFPESLGAMLNVLLKLRSERNAEQERNQLDPDVILMIASALAFQRLVVDGSLECPGTEAGQWIQNARSRCQGALGISDAPEQELADQLMAHDLLQRSGSGHYGFEHQLIAGALAAPLLAKEWRERRASLVEQVADDAWVFAARLVPPGDLVAYLDAVMDADLILGARSARDLPNEFGEHVFKMLQHCVTPNAPEPLRLKGVFALAALGSRKAIALLQTIAGNKSDDVQHAARVALATTGDPAFLKDLLDHVELMAALPAKVSGGDVAVWQAAPLPNRLDAARQRLTNEPTNDLVGESLIIISLERDKKDEALIRNHLRSAKDLKTWGKALHALNAIAPDRATIEVEQETSGDHTSTDRARLLRMAFLAGVAIDINAVCDCIMANDQSPSSDFDDEIAKTDMINDVFSKLEVPHTLTNAVAIELPQSKDSRRQLLWDVALFCKSSPIADHAFSCIESWSEDTWAACNYFLRHLDLAHERQSALVEACDAGLHSEEKWWIPRTSKAIELLAKLSLSETAKSSMRSILERLHRIRVAIEAGDTASLSPEDSAALSSSLPSHRLSELTMLAGNFLPVIAQIRSIFPARSLTDLLKFDFYTASAPEDLRLALSDCSDADIDVVLCDIKEPMVLSKSLAAVCPRGPTETRIELLGSMLRNGYSFPMILTQLCAAVDACWSYEVLEMVVNTVSSFPTWSDYEVQFFWSFARLIGQRVSKQDESLIAASIDKARTAHARRLLELWRVQASEARIGFPGFNESEAKFNYIAVLEAPSTAHLP